MKILLICCAGMSSSLLMEKLKDHLKELRTIKNISLEIEALPLERFMFSKIDYDLILLAPQIGYKLKEIKTSLSNKINIPIEIIPGRDYGLFNVENIINFSLNLINSNLYKQAQIIY